MKDASHFHFLMRRGVFFWFGGIFEVISIDDGGGDDRSIIDPVHVHSTKLKNC